MKFKTKQELEVYCDRLFRERGLSVTAVMANSREGILFSYDWESGSDIEVGSFIKKGEYYYF